MSGIDDPRRTEVANLPPEAQAGLADERSVAAQEAALAALERIASGPGAAAGVEAIIEGASPDDAIRMRAALGLPKADGRPRTSRDELTDDWRAGGYPYR